MLKKISWIVALLAALTIGLIGCTNAAFDWEPPIEAFEEPVLQVRPIATWAGFDLNNPAFKFTAGDVIQVTGKAVAANQVVLNINHAGWNSLWDARLKPDEEFDTGKITLTAAQASTIAEAVPPAIRVRGNTANGTFIIFNITVTRGGEEIFNLYEQVLSKLKPGETDYKVIFSTFGTKNLNDKTEQWVSEASADGAQCAFMILGPGVGGEAPADPDPEYTGGDLTAKGNNIKFTAGINTLYGVGASAVKDDKIEDLDPHVIGFGPSAAVDAETGVFSFVNTATSNGDSGLRYKFPDAYYTDTDKSKVRWNKIALDLEGDYDYIAIDYTVSNLSFPDAEAQNRSFKVKLTQYEGGWDGANYKLASAGQHDQYGDFGAGGTGTLTVQTWPAGGKGGIDINLNAGDTKAGKADIKINKVTFTKGVRYTVSYYSPQTGYAGSSQQVLKDNPPRPPAPALKQAGYTFIGWFDDWDMTTLQGTGTQYTDTTVVTATAVNDGELRLFAKWLNAALVTRSTTAAANDTLFTSSGSKFSYDGKQWWVIAHSGFVWNATYVPAAFTSAGTNAITAVNFDLDTTTPTPPAGVTLANYTSVRFTYDIVVIAGKTPTTVHGTWPELSSDGDDLLGATFTRPIAGNITSSAFSISFNDYQGVVDDLTTNYGAFLLRISKIEIIP